MKFVDAAIAKVHQIVIHIIEQTPPGSVGNAGFLLYLRVTGAAKMSQLYKKADTGFEYDLL